jgi:hypothetical protein
MSGAAGRQLFFGFAAFDTCKSGYALRKVNALNIVATGRLTLIDYSVMK